MGERLDLHGAPGAGHTAGAARWDRDSTVPPPYTSTSDFPVTTGHQEHANAQTHIYTFRLWPLA